ncbi:type VI secretion system Vgr family protein [Aquimarina longa]|uniref:type VI secretion system Vgr family protein n=2 Tax=Aquimarina longa TaxID=1080221 RepID=UPI0007867796|nr:phage baseplate assembly protein V [Aquimarina longa]
MALQTNTSIYLSGNKLDSYISLKLSQQLDAHHDLELVCRADVIEQLTEELIGESKDYLGGLITLQIQAVSKYGGYKELEFKGVVSGLEAIKGDDQYQGNLIVLQVKSTSILADDGEHYASYNDMNLSEIMERTFQGYDVGKLETNFAPRSSETIHYSVQHNQSAFSYASRLAAYHNEWFYYNGKQLIFGNPSTEETELIHGIDLRSFSIQLDTIANATSYISSDYLTGALHKKSSTEINTSSEGYHGFMDNKSRELYHKTTQVVHSLLTDPNQKYRLDQQVEQYTKAKSMKQVIARGSSDNPSVALGAIIKVKGYGSYRIISITHTNTEDGVYTNEFTAVEASSDTYPHMDLNRYPKSDITTGIVIDNNDPEGLGRIKVQLPWQKTIGSTTPWIRVMTPHAGAEKGFFFVSEKGEEVVIGFEGSNAEKAFVMGALYSGTASPSTLQADLNNRKSIRTRSQHLLEFDDTAGAESITITDKNGNAFKIDTANNNINITALENMTFMAKNIEFRATEDIKVSAGKNKTEQIAGNYNLTASNIIETASQNMRSQAEQVSLQSSTDATIASTSGNVNKQADQKVNNNSGEQGNVF